MTAAGSGLQPSVRHSLARDAAERSCRRRLLFQRHRPACARLVRRMVSVPSSGEMDLVVGTLASGFLWQPLPRRRGAAAPKRVPMATPLALPLRLNGSSSEVSQRPRPCLAPVLFPARLLSFPLKGSFMHTGWLLLLLLFLLPGFIWGYGQS